MSETSVMTPEFELPSVIDTPYPHIAIGDLWQVAQAIDPELDKQQCLQLQEELRIIRQSGYEVENATYYHTTFDALGEKVIQKLEESLEGQTDRTAVVHLDKYLYKKDDRRNKFAISVSRDDQGSLVPRVGEKLTLTEQLDMLAASLELGGYSRAVFVDDVLAYGDTVPFIGGELLARKPYIELALCVGIAACGGAWQGIEKTEAAGIGVDCVTRVIASPKINGIAQGMAIPMLRDFTLFGGKLGTDSNGKKLCYPYFLPFSIAKSGLQNKEAVLEYTQKLLSFNESFLDYVESGNGPLLLADILDRRFACPSSSIERFKARFGTDSNSFLRDNLAVARDLLKEVEIDYESVIRNEPPAYGQR